MKAPDRQRQIYVTGISGKKPIIPVSMTELEARAKQKMSKEAAGYVIGSASLETTARHNRSAFEKWQIVPNMLVDVSERDTSIELLGKKLPAPLLLSPVGVLDLAHKDKDIAVGKAAANTGIPFIFSNQASTPMEEVADAMGDGLRWFQLYWSKSNDLVASLVQRAEKCGCQAIVVTLDTTMLGWRPQDLDLAYLPFLKAMGIAQYTSDPVFQKIMTQPNDTPSPKPPITLKTLRHIYQLMSNYPGGFFKNLRSGKPMQAVSTFINIYSRPSLTWEDLAFLRTVTKLPIFLKGILHPDDGRKAVDYGVDGVIVSNHGGRQVDGSISSIEALPKVVAAINGQLPVLMDSGIRGGADMYKALALGAKAVCIGRPYVYGLALGGQQGVEEVIKNIMADFELTMGLSGVRTVAEITEDRLNV